MVTIVTTMEIIMVMNLDLGVVPLAPWIILNMRSFAMLVDCPGIVICLLGFEHHHSCMGGIRGLKCGVKCVECEGRVECVCGGY
jgi:hypothetical protein